MDESLYAGYLAHYGVKGMKWGQHLMAGKNLKEEVARKDSKKASEPKSEELVKQAKADFKQAKKEKLASFASLSPTAVAKSELKKQRAEEAYVNAKVERKLQKKTEKGWKQSAHQKKLTENYKKQGMSEEDAKIAAYRRAKTEKILAVAAVATVTAIAISQANKHKVDLDYFIPEGITMQHVTLNRDKGVSDAFYTSYTKADKKLYEGIYGGYQLNNGKRDIHIMTTQTNKKIKGAGLETQRVTVQRLLETDPEYAKTLRDAVFHKHMSSNLLMPGYKNAMNAISGKGKLNREGLLAVNTALNDHSKSGEAAANRLWNELRKKGYGTMVDTNDVFVSGYKAKSPQIILNGKTDLANRQVRTLKPAEARKKSYRYIAQIAGVPVAAFAGKGYVNWKLQKPVKDKAKSVVAEKRLIKEYKKEHPNTRLNDKQIIDLQLRR